MLQWHPSESDPADDVSARAGPPLGLRHPERRVALDRIITGEQLSKPEVAERILRVSVEEAADSVANLLIQPAGVIG